MIDSELTTDLRRPCTPSSGPASPTPRNLRFRGGPRVCGPRSPIDKWARSGPRRRPTIWGTWPSNLSPPIGINHLMRVKAQVAMVMNLDKCIGCHTCSVTCKQVWTNRPGTEYVWFNNVETKPGLGYPRRWEDNHQ